MQAHDVLDDREAEPGSAQRPAAGLVHAVEPLEQVRQMLLRDADAEVADGHRHLVTGRDGGDFNAVRSRITQGIGDKILQHLLEPTGIAFHRGGVVPRDLDADLSGGLALLQVNHGGDEIVKRYGLETSDVFVLLPLYLRQ